DAIRRITPPGVSTVVLGGLEFGPAIKAVREWYGSDKRGLMIRGGVGSGKSVAAGVAVHDYVRSVNYAASWHRPNDFVSAVLHAYDERSPKLGSGLVVVDDIGRETKADFEEALCAFIDDVDTRFILTTNLVRDDFRARYDSRLIDRLNHCAIAVSLKERSRRRQDGGF